jgi:hypothetical protein
MKKLTVLMAALFIGMSGAAFADPPKEGGPGKRPHPPMDCAKIEDADKKAKCEAHQAARKKCMEKEGDARKACMEEMRPKKKEG